MIQPPIIVFYHCLLRLGNPPEPLVSAFNIVTEQMYQFQECGLMKACTKFFVGYNDNDKEGAELAQMLFPEKAEIIYHGLESRSECLTIVAMEKFAKSFPGEAFVCYAHAKGASHPPDSAYGNGMSAPWRRAMMQDVVINWRRCIIDLHNGADLCCSRWMTGMADGTQNIVAGNFWFARKSFLARVPTIFHRERIKMSGIASLESRFEAEVWLGNSNPLPTVMQYRPKGGGGIP